jgi:hypothetical protein
LIGEACGLFVGSVAFNFPESARWQRTSRRILEKEIRLQIWDDGVNKEQAIHYQVFVFDLFLVAGLLARRNGADFSATYWEVLERMAEFVLALIDGEGRVPAIGDDDEAHVLVLSAADQGTPYQSLLGTAAALFGRADFRSGSAGFDEQAFWLLGAKGRETFENAQKNASPKNAFPFGGYYILRSQESWMLFDCGPLGYLSLAAHGHADALAILSLRYRGKEFLVDPGTYAYHTRRPWRDHFRGTSAHNTLRIDGVDQSVITGNFMWGQKAQAQLLEHGPDRVRGSHNGYTRLSVPLTHVREITFPEGSKQYTVTDILTGGTGHYAELFFHFSPECDVTREMGGVVAERDGIRISVIPDPRADTIELVQGVEDPIGGWYSPGYDRKVPASTLVCRYFHPGAITLTTQIRLL